MGALRNRHDVIDVSHGGPSDLVPSDTCDGHEPVSKQEEEIRMRNQGLMWTSIGVLITVLGTTALDGWTGTTVAIIGLLITAVGAVRVFRSRSQDRSDG